MGDKIQRLNQVAQDGDIDAKIQRLNGIAQQGDIDSFYNIIREDVKLLEHIDEFPFVDTPLHISASAGHFPFSCEMMILKPSFVSKRNLGGYTPIYLALLNGHIEMVRQLLQHNADLVRVKGRECMTPLHYTATTKDHLALLENFLLVCPGSITDVTIRNETALHIALKYDNLEAFKFLVGWLLRKWPYWRKILEQKDVEGNTVLHIAVSRNQTLAVSHLLAWGRRSVNINEKNLEGKTALDILEGQQTQGVDISKMRVILERAGALIASSLPTVTSYARRLRLPVCCERAIILIAHQLKGITVERRNALLVVATLLVTETYQAALSPPGGLWQDDLFKPNTTTAALSPPSPAGGLLNESNSNITAPHRAGSAIARRTDFFGLFFHCNTLIFFLSNLTMVVLVPPVEIIGFFLSIVCFMLCSCYVISMLLIVQAPDWTLYIVPPLPFIILVVTLATALFYFVLSSALKGIRALLNLIWKRSKRIKKEERAELGAVSI
ncbi:hypothetical protein SO802_019380 [Lithocarpus litseifolius]|uniref:PGG domain-containing protein n=1 Tax=Lithocarpus litseifolius TaxID=425828 RepID=A0AAW2CNI1_9ROSI